MRKPKSESQLNRDRSALDAGFINSQTEARQSMRERMMSAQEESKLRTQRAQMESETEDAFQQEGQSTSPDRIAKITGKNLNGTFNIAFCDGATAENVMNGYHSVKWLVDTWVTVTALGNDWQIVGISPYGAGPPTLPGP